MTSITQTREGFYKKLGCLVSSLDLKNRRCICVVNKKFLAITSSNRGLVKGNLTYRGQLRLMEAGNVAYSSY